tara:strand:+ start:523 stop:648 length:126 start_codon:yes stop_codon:yes gene_type:complete
MIINIKNKNNKNIDITSLYIKLLKNEITEKQYKNKIDNLIK